MIISLSDVLQSLIDSYSWSDSKPYTIISYEKPTIRTAKYGVQIMEAPAEVSQTVNGTVIFRSLKGEVVLWCRSRDLVDSFKNDFENMLKSSDYPYIIRSYAMEYDGREWYRLHYQLEILRGE